MQAKLEGDAISLALKKEEMGQEPECGQPVEVGHSTRMDFPLEHPARGTVL
jgi:hypothetical protein